MPVAIAAAQPGGEATETRLALIARRVNDGPGASPEQLSRRIVSIERE